MPEKDVRSILGSFLFRGDDVMKVVHNLSGGEKARLLLTKLALDKDNFLILDEPTNHLDIDSKEVLEKAIEEFDGTVLFVSHDRYFINKTASSVLEITPEGSTLYLGDYDYYVQKKAEQEEIQAAKEAAQPSTAPQPAPVSQSKLDYQQSKELQRQQRKAERTVAKLEEQLNHLEEQKNSLEKQMTQPENFNDPAKMSALQVKLDTVTSQIETTEEQWTEASMVLESFE